MWNLSSILGRIKKTVKTVVESPIYVAKMVGGGVLIGAGAILAISGENSFATRLVGVGLAACGVKVLSDSCEEYDADKASSTGLGLSAGDSVIANPNLQELDNMRTNTNTTAANADVIGGQELVIGGLSRHLDSQAALSPTVQSQASMQDDSDSSDSNGSGNSNIMLPLIIQSQDSLNDDSDTTSADENGNSDIKLTSYDDIRSAYNNLKGDRNKLIEKLNDDMVKVILSAQLRSFERRRNVQGIITAAEMLKDIFSDCDAIYERAMNQVAQYDICGKAAKSGP